MTEPSAEAREFPVQSSHRYGKPHPTRVPWSIADKAYSMYSARYGRDQSLERLGERGGFGPEEMDEFCPGWIEESSEITRLARALAEKDARLAQAYIGLDEAGRELTRRAEKLTEALAWGRQAFAAIRPSDPHRQVPNVSCPLCALLARAPKGLR